MARGVAIASAAAASYTSRVPTTRWGDAEVAGQMHDAEMPVVRTRRQAEWLEELDDLLRREVGHGAAAAEAAVAVVWMIAVFPCGQGQS